jgi:G3E family GTPase
MSDTTQRLPTVLITGFLGAGKTTFLNHLLEDLRTRPERVCLIINEFGKVGIDSGLLSAGPETIHEVNAGSIFCVCTRDQFLGALARTAEADPPFDLLVIEATGIAATSDLGAYIYGPPLDGQIAVMQNICLVDAANFHKVRATLPAATNQVEEAGVLVVNKADLVDETRIAELKRELASINPRAGIHVCTRGAADVDAVLGDYRPQSEWRAKHELATVPPESVNSVSLQVDGELSSEAFDRFLADLPDDLLRGKGNVLLDGRPTYVEWVVGEWSRRELAGADLNGSVLVLIGRDLDAEALQAAFEACAGAP